MSRPKRFIAAILVVLAGSVAMVGPVAAYDGAGAATWADNNALNPNCQISPCLPNDCASFVSQALHFGGNYPYYGVGSNTHDHHYWWLKWIPYATWAYSDSWGGVTALYDFQMLHIPGGTDYGGIVPGMSLSASGLSKGDIATYDWTNNGSKDHVSMITVTSGTDPNASGWTGSLVSAHNTNRYHAYWTLAPYNQYALTTKIQRVHIYATN